LFSCRGRLEKNEDDEWCLYIHKAIASPDLYLGSGEGVHENIASVTEYKKTPTSEALKKVIVNYNWNEWESKYMDKYERSVFTFGEEREYDLPFVKDHTTADIITCYIKQTALLMDKRLTVEVGMAARNNRVWDLVDVQYRRFNIEEDFQIFNLTRRVNSFTLGMKSYNGSVFTYTPDATINIEPVSDATVGDRKVTIYKKDYKYPENPSYEKPKPPINIQGISWSYLVAATGEITARILGQAQKHPDDINFSHIKVGIRDYQVDGIASTVPFKWYTGYEYDRANQIWRIVLDFPASAYHAPTDGTWFHGGKATGAKVYFDAAVKSVNTFGRESDFVFFPHEMIGYKSVAVGLVPASPPKISGTISASNMFKTFTWSWTDSTVTDIMDYHFQIDEAADFAAPILDRFTRTNFVTYTTTLDYSASIYFRVRPRNSTYIEGALADANANWLDSTATVTESINIPTNSITGMMIATALAGDGLTYDSTTTKNLKVNVDTTSIEISSDVVRVRDGGILAAKLATDAVTTIKIQDDAVNENKIKWSGASSAPDMTAVIGSILVDVGGTIRKIPIFA
jgi:hypothetical protein